MPLIGTNFPADLLAVAFGLAVEVSVTTAASDGGHEPHPEVITVGADGMNGLLETNLDLIAQTIELNDPQGIQMDVGAEEDDSATVGMIR